MEDLKIDTDDPAVQHALTELLTNENYMWVFELSEEGKDMLIWSLYLNFFIASAWSYSMTLANFVFLEVSWTKIFLQAMT